MKNLIIKNLKLSENLFHDDELAFLSLTSKIENPIRDALAYQLYKNINDDFLVSREWNRTDIAILKNGNPEAIIELKAMYTFDALIEKNILNYREKIDKDLIKLKRYSNENTSGFFILLATHPFSHVNSQYSKVIKYSYDINKSLNLNSKSEIKEIANNNILKCFLNYDCISSDELIGGKAFCIETNVLYWIFQEKL